jgi:hypothetical protein
MDTKIDGKAIVATRAIKTKNIRTSLDDLSMMHIVGYATY